MSTLSRRVSALEQQKAPSDVPQVIRVSFLKPEGEPSTDEDIRLAFIIGRPGLYGGQVSREEGESSESFMARVEAERFRVHGPKP
jgi:hypothetical protein